MSKVFAYLALSLALSSSAILSKAASLSSGYVTNSSSGSEFFVGVIAELSSSRSPSILVTTDDREAVNFTLLVRDLQFERNATVKNGSVVSIPLPRPSQLLSSLIDSDTAILGVQISTQTDHSSIKVFLSSDTGGTFPALPYKEMLRTRREDLAPYSYQVSLAVQMEQPLTRSTLLLVGCQDTTSIQIFSTDELSLPVSLNATATIDPLSSRNSVTTSFMLNQLDTVAIQPPTDISITHILSSKPTTVTLVSTANCSRTAPSGVRNTGCVRNYTQIAPSLTVAIVFLERDSYTVLEDDSTVELTIVREGNDSEEINILFTTDGDTALGGEDFVEVNRTLTFLPGERSKTVVISILDDLLLEENETFHVSISADNERVAVARGNASVTIKDTDALEVGFERDSYTVDEVTGRLEVNITSPTPFPGPLEVVLTMTTTDGTAEAPDDYFPLNLFLVFTPGTQHITVTLHAFEDRIVEPELEWFSLSLGVLIVPAGRVVFSKPNATIFIEDTNTLQLELVPSSVMAQEGGQRGSEVTIVVSSTGNTVRPVTVFLVTFDLTTTAGEDYVPVDVALTFTENQTSFAVVVEVLGDSVVEGDEVVVAEVVVPEGESGVSLQSSSVEISIIDDDSVEMMFSREEVTVSEADGVAELTVIKSGANSRDVVVTFSTLDGNAVDGEDYTSSTGRLTFSPEDTFKRLEVAVRDDAVVEYQERFIVALSVPEAESGVTLADPRRVVVTITNDDSVEVGFMEAVYTVSEGEREVQLMITKSGSNTREVGVTFATEQHTAISPDDFTGRAEIIMFSSVDTTSTVSVPIVDDSLAEREERFRVTLIPAVESVVTLSPGREQATVVIIDNDHIMVGFSESVYVAREGEMAVAIGLNRRGTTNLPVTVVYSTQDDTATADEDYVSLTTNNITFSGTSGETPAIQLRLRDDRVPERTEQLFLQLMLPPLLEFDLRLDDSSSSTTVVILDNDDVTVKFEPVSYSVLESSASVAVRLVLLGETSNTVAITVRTVDMEAVAPGDYSQMMISLVFEAGDTEKTVAVPIAEDMVLEGPQSFSLEISPLSTGVLVDDTPATVVIEDNDVLSVGFQRSLVTTSEEAGTAEVRVELNSTTEIPIMILVSSQDDTAAAEEDYSLQSESLLFAPGQSSAALSVGLTSDSAVEFTERFLLVLSSANDTRVLIDPQRQMAAVDIRDTSVVQVWFQNVSVEVGESEETVTLSLSVSGELQRPVAVHISTRDETATAGDDYVVKMEELVIMAGGKGLLVEIEILDDFVVERNEFFAVDLTTSDGSLTVATPSANVTIIENDSIMISFDRDSYTVDEGEGHVVVMVTMVGNNTLVDVPVFFSTIDNTAIGISTVADYVGVDGLVLTFGPSQSEHSVQITIIDDTALEHTELFTVALSRPAGEERVSFSDSQTTVSITDNDEVSLEFGRPLFFAIEGEPVVFLTVRRVGLSYIDIPFTVTTHSATATADVDFMSAVPVVDFLSFQQRQFVPIMILDDRIVEGDEHFLAELQILPTIRGVELTSDPVRITILENDFVVVMFDPVMYTAREETGHVTLTASVEGVSVINTSLVIYTTSDENSTAEADEDFNTTVIFVDVRPNDTLIKATVPIINDAISEGVEIFTVAMSSMSEFLLIENSVAIVQIIDSDDTGLRVGFEAMKYSVSEGEGAVDVCLTASQPLPHSLSFLVYTEDRTAEGDVDFVSVVREVQFEAGQRRVCVAIDAVDDRVMERTEDLLVFVESDPMNGILIEGLSIAPAVTDVCITDNDNITIGFEEGDVSIVEGSAAVVVKVLKIGSSAETVGVVFATEEGTAESGVDYDPLRGVLTFSPSETEKEIAISINDDGLIEGQEYFSVILSLPMSLDDGVITSQERVRVTIEDNDMVMVEFEREVYTVAEDGGTLTVCVTKDKATPLPITLLLTPMEFSPPSATEGGDFSGSPATITLPASTSTTCTELNVIIDDSVHENPQHFRLKMELVSTSQSYIGLGTMDSAVITILDNDVIQIMGVNRTVAESDGEVEVCLEMDKVAETPVSVDITFSKNTDSTMTPAQGGVDFDSTPRSVVFGAGETRACIDVDIFPDSLDEQTETFTVVITSPDDGVLPPTDGGPVITITDDQGSLPAALTCRAMDSVVIEPFRSPTAPLDSYTFHSPCQHVLLTTSCGGSTRDQLSLRVTVNFSPSNLDLQGLAVSINCTRNVKVSRNSVVELKNFPDPIFSNRTHSLYPGGILIVQLDQSVSVTIEGVGVEIRRLFGVENRVEIHVLEAVRLCGLCGTVYGRLVFSGGATEAISIDSALVEEFASSWRVSPQELLLGQQGEECGAIRNDSIVGDPLFTVPLNFPSIAPSALMRGDAPHLCFEVHGERERVFNLISDRCTSVNALFIAMTPPHTGNVINTVGITAVDHRGNCIEIEVSLQTGCAPVIRGGNGSTTNLTRYSRHGVSVRRHQQGVRVAVANCESTPLVLWVLCEDARNTSMIKFIISRGVNLRPTSHGLLGQFWNIPVAISPMTATTPAPLTLNSLPPPYILTLSPPLSRPRRFIARLYSNTWDKRGRECYYAGSAQGGSLGEIESPQLRDSVIEGRYTDYIVDSLFATEFTYTQFDSSECNGNR